MVIVSLLVLEQNGIAKAIVRSRSQLVGVQPVKRIRGQGRLRLHRSDMACPGLTRSSWNASQVNLKCLEVYAHSGNQQIARG